MDFVIVNLSIQRVICWRVWGTPANLNGFHVFAALLHGTLIVGVGETLRHWTEASPIFDRAAITLGIGPHSSWFIKWPCVCVMEGRRCVLSDSVGSWSAGAGYSRHRPWAADATWSTRHFDVQPQQEGIRSRDTGEFHLGHWSSPDRNYTVPPISIWFHFCPHPSLYWTSIPSPGIPAKICLHLHSIPPVQQLADGVWIEFSCNVGVCKLCSVSFNWW